MDRPAWLAAAAVEVPAADDWLSTAERAVLAGLRVPARRRDWRLGRWTAKRAVGAALGAGAEAVELVAAPDGAPEALLGGRPAPVGVSISHRAGLAVCLVAPPGAAAGCDLELVEPRAGAFARDFFTRAELALVEATGAGRRDLAVTLVWSAKESALKALRQGLRLDTREVEVSLDLDACPELGWRPLAVGRGTRAFGGWWRPAGRCVLTAVLEPAGPPPRRLLPLR